SSSEESSDEEPRDRLCPDVEDEGNLDAERVRHRHGRRNLPERNRCAGPHRELEPLGRRRRIVGPRGHGRESERAPERKRGAQGARGAEGTKPRWTQATGSLLELSELPAADFGCPRSARGPAGSA